MSYSTALEVYNGNTTIKHKGEDADTAPACMKNIATILTMQLVAKVQFTWRHQQKQSGAGYYSIEL